jgi:hypothetical protein
MVRDSLLYCVLLLLYSWEPRFIMMGLAFVINVPCLKA